MVKRLSMRNLSEKLSWLLELRSLVLIGGLFLTGSLCFTVAFQLPAEVAEWLHFGWSYYVCMGLFVAFLASAVLALAPCLKTFEKSALLRHIPPILCLVVVWIGGILTNPMEYKVLNDEAILVGISQSFELDKKTEFHHGFAYNNDGGKVLQFGGSDKRPVMFPFVLSLLHEVFGYSVENAFYLNVFLGLLIMFFSYGVFYRWTGSVLPALAGAVLFGALPEFMHTIHGAGFETMNLLFIVLWIFVLDIYLKSPSARFQDLILAVVLVMTYTRYESVLFVIPTALVIAYRWFSDRRVSTGWVLPLTPFCFIPFVWGHRQFFDRETVDWQFHQFDRGHGAFHPSYFFENLTENMSYFFQWGDRLGNSLVLSILGFLSLGILIFIWLRFIRSRQFSKIPGSAVCSFAVFGVIGLLYLFYFWSSFTNLAASRFSISFSFVLAGCVALVTGYLSTSHFKKLGIVVFGLVVVSFFGYSIPKMSNGYYKLRYLPTYYSERVAVFQDMFPKETMVVSADSVVWVTYEQSVISVGGANYLKDRSIRSLLGTPALPEMYYFERTMLNTDTGIREPIEETMATGPVILDPEYEQELVFEQNENGFFGWRLFKLTIPKIEGAPSPDTLFKESASGGSTAPTPISFAQPEHTDSIELINTTDSLQEYKVMYWKSDAKSRNFPDGDLLGSELVTLQPHSQTTLTQSFVDSFDTYVAMKQLQFDTDNPIWVSIVDDDGKLSDSSPISPGNDLDLSSPLQDPKDPPLTAAPSVEEGIADSANAVTDSIHDNAEFLGKGLDQIHDGLGELKDEISDLGDNLLDDGDYVPCAGDGVITDFDLGIDTEGLAAAQSGESVGKSTDLVADRKSRSSGSMGPSHLSGASSNKVSKRQE